MTTTIKPSISRKNLHYISKHRYYELKHYCLQYDEWKDAYHRLANPLHSAKVRREKSMDISDPTGDLAVKKQTLFHKIESVEQTALATDPNLSNYILLSVTKGLTYEALQFRYDIPCSRGTFYDRYRKFFWLLSERQ